MDDDDTKPAEGGPDRAGTDAAPSASSGEPRERCDWCGSSDLWWRNCKLLCRNCSAIVKSCADL